MSHAINVNRLPIEEASAFAASAAASPPHRSAHATYRLARATDGAVLHVETRNLMSVLEGERFVLRIATTAAPAWLILNVDSPPVRKMIEGAMPGTLSAWPARLKLLVLPGRDGIDFSIAGLLDAVVAKATMGA